MGDSHQDPKYRKVRTLLKLFYALPVLLVLGVVGILVYMRATHQRPPVHHISSSPFAIIPIGGLTASVFTDGPALRAGPNGNDVIIEFRDAKGKLTDVGSVLFSLSIQSPEMVMHSIGKVFNTSTPGQYRTTISPGVKGDWTVTLSYTNASGTASATAPVKVL